MAGSLVDDIRVRIASRGPLPFAEFMEFALYHPSQGYYAARVPGHGGDYLTSPSISPWFGRLVAGEIEAMWEALGRPDPFWVVEAGAGSADLAAGAIEGLNALGDALHWRFIERFDRVREWQRRRLGSAAACAEWAPRLGEAPAVDGCVLANEVLDNFPVHVLEATATGDAREVYVDLDGDRFVESLGPLSSDALVQPARAAAPHVGDGGRFEVCPQVQEWCGQASRAIEHGYLLLIDYGGAEPDLWVEHPHGTVAVHGPVDADSSPLAEPGRKDVTAKVNFSAVARAAGSAGFGGQSLVCQREWLLSLGLAEVAGALEIAGLQAALEGWAENAMVLEGELRQLLQLGDAGLGDLLVLRGAKGVPAPGQRAGTTEARRTSASPASSARLPRRPSASSVVSPTESAKARIPNRSRPA